VYILLLNEQNQQRGVRGGREEAQNKHRKERDWSSFSEEGGRGGELSTPTLTEIIQHTRHEASIKKERRGV
jgi:hypothetical protein